MNRLKNLLFAAAAVMAALGCSDTALAQPTLTVTPSTVTSSATPMVFSNIPSGGASKTAQTVSVTASTNTSVAIQVSQSSPWLLVDGTGQLSLNVGTNNAVSLSVAVNTNAGGQIFGTGTYSGSFTINIVGAPNNNSQVTVYVTMTVTGTSLLSANPTSIAFSANQGATFATASSACPNITNNGCIVQIASSGAQLSYTLQATTNLGGNWLLLSTTNGTTGDAGFLVSVNPSALQATTSSPYTGTITAQSTTTGDSVTISISLTVTSSAALTVTPANPPPFLYQVGKDVPAPQQLMITATGGSSNFNVITSPNVSWLVLSTFSGQASATPFILTLSVNPTSLQPNTYTTNVIVTPVGGSALPAVPITLVVSNNGLLQLSKTTLSYTSQFSNNPPPDQQVNVTTTNGTVGFTFSSDSNWLTASASTNTTPATLTVHVNPTGLLVQTYNGNITIRPTNGDNYTETIAVSLAVVNGSAVTAGPPDLLFTYQTNQGQPLAQNVALNSSGPAVPINIATSTSTCGPNWMQAALSSSTTPATLTVNVATTGLTAGTCSGTVTVSYNSGNGATSLAIPVTLAVTTTSALVVNMPSGFGNETVPVGSGAFTRQIALTSTDPNTSVTFSASSTSTGGTWLLVGAGSNVTPQNLVVQFLPAGLAPGPYTGQIVISSPSLGATQLTIPVLLTVTSNVTVTVSASSLSFNEAQAGPTPAAQTLTLTSTGSGGSATYTASIASITGGNWLQISPTSGQANGTVQVSILANNLSPGNYPAQILLTFQGSATPSATVNVTLVVSSPQSISLTATSLSFAYQITGTQPASQKITVSGSPGVAFSVGTTSSGWLSTDIIKGTTPQDINVSINTQGLAAQTYNGSISVSAPGVLGNPILVSVSLVVTAAPAPQPVTVVSAASFVAGVIAPGELITIKGNNLGPATPASGVSFTLNSSGGVNSTLAGVQVMFDNIPGTPIYVSATQINVSVPYEIAGRLSTNMVVTYQGAASSGIPLRLADTALGLFTNNFTGSGQVAAINQNGTYNGATSGFAPAPQDSEISIYATGGGVTNPRSATGSVTPVPTSAAGLVLIPGTVTATVGGVQASVDFAGNAPGLITGIVQFNVHIPKGVTGNNVSIILSINGVSNPLGTTIAVQ